MVLMPGYFGDGFRDLSFVGQKPVLSKRKTLQLEMAQKQVLRSVKTDFDIRIKPF